MLLRGMVPSKRFGNREDSLNANRLHYGLPIHTNYLCHFGSFLVSFYYTDQHAHAPSVRTRISLQTLPMLFQQSHRGIHLPSHTSSGNDYTRIRSDVNTHLLSNRGWWSRIGTCRYSHLAYIGYGIYSHLEGFLR